MKVVAKYLLAVGFQCGIQRRSASNVSFSPFNRFSQLDDHIRPGTTLPDFRRLWVVCRSCHRVIFRESAIFHTSCPAPDWLPPPRQDMDEQTTLFSALGFAQGKGLTRFQFRSLFVICDCGIVATKRVFDKHYCTERPLEQLNSTTA